MEKKLEIVVQNWIDRHFTKTVDKPWIYEIITQANGDIEFHIEGILDIDNKLHYNSVKHKLIGFKYKIITINYNRGDNNVTTSHHLPCLIFNPNNLPYFWLHFIIMLLLSVIIFMILYLVDVGNVCSSYLLSNCANYSHYSIIYNYCNSFIYK